MGFSKGCLLIFFGRLADLYGRKRAFILGNIFSALFGLGCGFAQGKLSS
jgi:MFS family permease